MFQYDGIDFAAEERAARSRKKNNDQRRDRFIQSSLVVLSRRHPDIPDDQLAIRAAEMADRLMEIKQ